MKLKKFVGLFVIVFSIFILNIVAHAYNGKFTYNVTSGWMSPWAYSNAAYKVTNSESPVVSATYISGDTNKFIYDVVNSDSQTRAVKKYKTGTFKLEPFERHITVKGYKYWLAVRRNGAEFWQSAKVQGMWNIDGY